VSETMTRDQAEEIQRHLLDAARAMDRASAAISDLGEEARRRFAKPLGNVVCDLHFELLRMIYQGFPDLQPPPREIPTINSTLRWEEVDLAPSITESDLDEVIFSVMEPQWRKTAMIVGCANERCRELSWSIEPEVLAARIQALADADRIEHQGDLRSWRFSEVRLKP
jgi:hypothetical protein